jgi:membrane protein
MKIQIFIDCLLETLKLIDITIDPAAAFAYYMLQSFFPILLISLAIASLFLGKKKDLNEILIKILDNFLPPSSQKLVKNTLDELIYHSVNAGIIGMIFLFITSSNAYLNLKRGSDFLYQRILGLNTNQKFSLNIFIFSRIEAFFVICLIGIIIIMYQISANIKKIPITFLNNILCNYPFIHFIASKIKIAEFSRLLLQFFIYFSISLLLLIILPTYKIGLYWKGMIPGAILIAFLLIILNLLVNKSILSLGDRYKIYGYIGVVLIFTLWLWLIGIVIYTGQVFNINMIRRIYKITKIVKDI